MALIHMNVMMMEIFMTRKIFSEKLTEKFESFSLSNKTLYQFKNFQLLNEAPEMVLSSGQIRGKYKYRRKLAADPELKEQYYIWHLLLTLNTKWNLIRLEIVVTQYYRNSKIIQEIYGGENEKH